MHVGSLLIKFFFIQEWIEDAQAQVQAAADMEVEATEEEPEEEEEEEEDPEEIEGVSGVESGPGTP